MTTQTNEAQTKILFVDDDRDVLSGIRASLLRRRKEWKMTFTDSGADALQALSDGKFDAIFLDVRMPGMSGFELLERLKNTEATKHIPVVMLTGAGDNGLKRKALAMGADDLLTKPTSCEDLSIRIESILRTKQ